MQNRATLFISVQSNLVAESLNACPVPETMTVTGSSKVAVGLSRRLHHFMNQR